MNNESNDNNSEVVMTEKNRKEKEVHDNKERCKRCKNCEKCAESDVEKVKSNEIAIYKSKLAAIMPEQLDLSKYNAELWKDVSDSITDNVLSDAIDALHSCVNITTKELGMSKMMPYEIWYIPTKI